MRYLDIWLETNIDNLFYLNNVNHYRSAIGVRGHDYILKFKARNYLLTEANKILSNKLRRRRVKQTDIL